MAGSFWRAGTGTFFVFVYSLTQVPVVPKQQTATVACSRLSTNVNDTIVALRRTLRGNGAQQRQITTETDYGATAEELAVCIKRLFY